MPIPIQSTVGPVGPATAGTSFQPRLGPTGELVENQMYGKYYEATRLGLVFTASQAVAGVALLTATSTTVNFAFYNPPASGKRAILLKATFGYVSATLVAGHIAYAVTPTNQTTVTGTSLTINNNLIGGAGSAMAAYSTATMGAASTYFRPSKYSNFVPTAAAVAAPWAYDEDFDGSIVVPPGIGFAIGGSIALAIVAVISLTWIELPNAAGT